MPSRGAQRLRTALAAAFGVTLDKDDKEAQKLRKICVFNWVPAKFLIDAAEATEAAGASEAAGEDGDASGAKDEEELPLAPPIVTRTES